VLKLASVPVPEMVLFVEAARNPVFSTNIARAGVIDPINFACTK
jgi:hypothetical protein